MMTVQNPFEHILELDRVEDNRFSDADHQAKNNPFWDAIVSSSIMENIKAAILLVKEAVTQPFQTAVDCFFSNVATSEQLKQPKILKKMQQSITKIAQQASKGLAAPGVA